MKTILILLISLFVTNLAFSQDRCSDVLKNIYNQYQSYSLSDYSKIITTLVTNKSIEKASRESGIDINVFKKFSVGGSQGKIKELQNKYQNFGEVKIEDFEVQSIISNTINNPSIDAWKDCMSDRKWKIDIVGDIYETFNLSITWVGGAAIEPEVEGDVQLSNITSKGINILKNRLTFIDSDTKSQIFKRIDNSQNALIVINFKDVEDVVIDLPKKQIIKDTEKIEIKSESYQLDRGIYKIKAKNSGKCWHVTNASKNDRAEIRQWSCSDEPHFLFEIIPSGNYYKIISVNSKKCLHITNASAENRAGLWQWSCIEKPHFEFEIIPTTGKYYSIKAKHSGKCLHVENDSVEDRAPILQWSCTNSPHFEFEFIKVR